MDAYGVMFLDPVTGKMTPLVKVIAPNTLIWEGSCGSGSLAAAVCKSQDAPDGEFAQDFIQPAGIVRATVVRKDGAITAAFIGVKDDPLADLHEDLAAEQKARVTYDNLLRLADDPDVKDVLRFLRQREIVHYQRFAEALEMVKDGLDCRNFYAFNPAREGHYPLKKGQ